MIRFVIVSHTQNGEISIALKTTKRHIKRMQSFMTARITNVIMNFMSTLLLSGIILYDDDEQTIPFSTAQYSLY